MKVVIASATEKEVLLIKEAINPAYLDNNATFNVSFVETGVGLLASCFSLSKLIFESRPAIILQAGIAGAFDSKLILGDVVIVKEEILADTGVEENGVLQDLFDLKLLAVDFFPFTNKKLVNPAIKSLNFLRLPEVTGITVNEITTRLSRIEQYKAKYGADLESMEGAALHYCGLQTSTSFIQVRAISNFIGERDKSKWKFKEALKNLSEVSLQYIDHLHKMNKN